jgi:hypothetical protein
MCGVKQTLAVIPPGSGDGKHVLRFFRGGGDCVARGIRAAIAAQTVIGETGPEFFDRWFGATRDALAGAAAGGAIEGWRIVVGDNSGQDRLDDGTIAHYDRRAQAVGGAFTYVRLDPGVADQEGHHRLFEQGSEDLVLVVDPDVIILASTVLRMVRSLTPEVGVLEARRVPLDVSAGLTLGATGVVGSGGRCLLVSRRPLRSSVDGRIELVDDSVGVWQEAWSTDLAPVRCPGAVVFGARRPLVASASTPHLESIAVDSVGSLLEEIMNVPALDEARQSVARALTMPDPALLSIVMRTQVLRPEALRDVLLCLAAQTDGRFELLLVVHDGSLEQAALILEDQPEWLRSRTRILAASGGTRSRPLNVGIAAATGSLVAFLDDDDLVFQHWVESFLDATTRHPRKVIRASAGVQWVATAIWPGGVEGHRDESEVSTPYPTVFDLADHLRVNMTPLMALAFPRRFFDVFGGADESLEVCEDWDLALRAASVLGVSDIPPLTAIYRRWNSGRDSYSVHDRSIWERDMARVRSRLDANPILVPAGSAADLERFSNQRGLPEQLAATYASSSWRITAPLRATARFARKSWIRVVTLTRGSHS